MVKEREPDLSEEVSDRTESNFNPYLWVANLLEAPVSFAILSLALLFILIVSITEHSLSSTKIPLIFIIPFWYVSLLRTRMFLVARKQIKEAQNIQPRESKKKKTQKHRKDYR